MYILDFPAGDEDLQSYICGSILGEILYTVHNRGGNLIN